VLEVENEETAVLQREIDILSQCHSKYIVEYKGSFEKEGHIWVGAAFRPTRRLSSRLTVPVGPARARIAC
jgi:hypothetical protein